MPTTAASHPRLPTRIETDRLVLRRHRRADAPSLTAMLNNWNVVRWLDEVPYPYRDKDAIAWIDETERRWQARLDFQFMAALRRRPGDAIGGTVIGQIGIHPSPEDSDAGELGYWLGEGHWGRGYASEAAHAMVRYAFEQIGVWRVVAVCLPDNGRSLAVLSRAGLNEVGRRRRRFHGMTSPVDVPFLRLTRRDYEDAMEAGPAARAGGERVLHEL